MVFITAGMGGGTGTGAAPVVAEIAREMGILTVGVVTKPFAFEGHRRMQQAENGIEELRCKADSLVIIPNEHLKRVTDKKITFANAFQIADEVLLQAVQSFSGLIQNTGFINLDFADVRTIMKDGGLAHIGIGRAEGHGKAVAAAQMAITSPLMETGIDSAQGILISIIGSNNISLEEVEQAASHIQNSVYPDANIIFGAAFDESMNDGIRVTVIATGFDKRAEIGENNNNIPETQPELAGKSDSARNADEFSLSDDSETDPHSPSIKNPEAQELTETADDYDQPLSSQAQWIESKPEYDESEYDDSEYDTRKNVDNDLLDKLLSIFSPGKGNRVSRNALRGIHSENTRHYGIDEYMDYREDAETFTGYMLRIIKERGLKEADVYNSVFMDRKLFNKIRNDLNYQPSKRTAMLLAIALRLNLAETQEFIGKAGYVISRSNKIDLIVEYFIQEGNYNILEINEMLHKFGLQLLLKCD